MVKLQVLKEELQVVKETLLVSKEALQVDKEALANESLLFKLLISLLNADNSALHL